MKERIENEFISCEVAYAGAELQSIYSKTLDKELLWQGDDKWWPRKSPVLFPIVGKLNNNTYSIKGNKYNLPQHGFARDRKFLLANRSDNSLTFLLSSDTESLKVFPFEFDIYIHYMIDQARLTVTYEVINKDINEIFFSIGAHPGFNCPLYEDESLADYYLEFEESETLERHLLDGGNFNGKTENLLTESNRLDLDEKLFTKDAIVFKNMRSSHMLLRSRKSDYSLKFGFNDFPYFGIWTKPGAPFICLEPWCGIADNNSFSGELRDKEGINKLNPSETFIRSFFLEV
ncbi:MAG: LacX-related protein [Bacteroidota bacterium]|jgi:galactose mutarotase-like enzyme|nr:LacX-related protein [Bacteroidota bacterium]